MIPINLSSLIANSSSPLYDPAFPTGNRSAGAVLLSRLNTSTIPITNGSVSAGVNGWAMGYDGASGALLTVANDGTYDYLRAQFPTPTGGNYFYGGYTPPTLQEELFITLYARMPSTVKHGCKFIKIFGQKTTSGVPNPSGAEYANVTFGIDYSGESNGGIIGTAFGDGDTVQNDTAAMVDYTQRPWAGIGRSASVGGNIVTRGVNWDASNWSTTWHKFQFRAKLNSVINGVEVNDGIFETYIDGLLWGGGYSLFNRNVINHAYESINLFGWSQSGTAAFELNIRNGMTVSTGDWID